MPKMKEDELLSVIDGYISTALGNGGKLAEDRRKALQYYNGEAKGDLSPPDIDGRSSVVSTEVADTVEWIMPALLRIFTSGDNAVEFTPQGPEDENAATQATEFVNYVFYKQNPGFLLMHTWFKDALLQKYGVLKVWWESKKDDAVEEYRGISEDELALMMMEQPEYEVVKSEQAAENINGNPVPLLNVSLRKKTPKAQVRIDAIPPEEFLVDRRARSLDTAMFLDHRVQRSMSDLKASGYPKDKLDQLGDDRNDAYWSIESIERSANLDDIQQIFGAESNDKSQRMIWLHECYARIDFDGDGIAEWRQIVKAGNVILRNEKVDGHPFVGLTPILMPHRLIGRSVAELVMDLQRIKTALVRQMLDNMYMLNNGRMYVDTTKEVNLDDLLNNRPGGIVRGRGPDGVTPLTPPPIGASGFSLIEYFDTVRENRVGVTRYNQGIDANSLNKTATGISQIMNASQQRIELIARVFAETGVRELFRKILKLCVTNGDVIKGQVVRLTNGYAPIDPAAWRTQFDMSINVGLGTGDKDQQAAHLTNILQVQQQLFQAGIVTPANLYATAKRLPEVMGLKSGNFFTDPTQPDPNQPPQQDSGPNPDEIKLQADIQTRQAELAMKAKELELKERDLKLREEQAEASLAIQREANLLAHERAMQELSMKYATAPITPEQQVADIQALADPLEDVTEVEFEDAMPEPHEMEGGVSDEMQQEPNSGYEGEE